MIGQLIPEWHEQAACAGTKPDLWFPETRGQAKRAVDVALRICQGCPVREKCLAWARGHDERYGIWGGVSMRGER